MLARAGRLLTNLILMRHAVPAGVRNSLLRRVGYDVAPSAVIRSGTLIKTSNLTVGANSFLNHQCFIDDGRVDIGDRVYVGPRVVFASTTHDIGPRAQRAGIARTTPIVVGNGAWIGAGAIIMAGVTVAEGCIIAAGAVVTKNTEQDGLYAGVPARRLRDL